MRVHRVIINGQDRGVQPAGMPAIELQHMLSREPGSRFVRVIERIVKEPKPATPKEARS